MQPRTFIFTGRSGCGKGTQVELLKQYLKNSDPGREIYHLETGARFRKFVESPGYSSGLAKKVNEQGGRQPDFLAVWMWSHLFVDELKGNEHIIIDGTPRSRNEAIILDSALAFYERARPEVVCLKVSREWSERHLKSRARKDDTPENIKNRLDWYERDVLPALDYYKTDPAVKIVEINGEQSVEQVHQELINRLFPH